MKGQGPRALLNEGEHRTLNIERWGRFKVRCSIVQGSMFGYGARALDQALAIDASGAGIGEGGFELAEMTRAGAKIFGVAAGFGADLIEEAQDGGFGAETTVSGLTRTEASTAIELEYFIGFRT